MIFMTFQCLLQDKAYHTSRSAFLLVQRATSTVTSSLVAFCAYGRRSVHTCPLGIKIFSYTISSAHLFVVIYYNCRFYNLPLSCLHRNHMTTVDCTDKSYIFLVLPLHNHLLPSESHQWFTLLQFCPLHFLWYRLLFFETACLQGQD